jgi:hypothetical protein
MQRNLARSLAFLALLAVGANAQEPAGEAAASGFDDLEPAVSSEALADMGSASEAGEEPMAPEAVIAGDVRRTASSSGVMDEIDLDRTEITGNQELPKVLYIVPWQKSEAGELVGKPVNTLLEEVLAPIDRTEFIRQVDYYGDLYGEDDEE